VCGDRLRNLFRPRPRALLSIDADLWQQVLDELRIRGDGRRESGAFLLGASLDGWPRQVTDAVYYDDLDPESLTGAIAFSGSAYGRLWDECAARGLKVVADVHTHPGEGVMQSSIDRAHPMLAQAGHIALIVPGFAASVVDASAVGVHEYHGDGRWSSHLGRDAARRLQIRRDRWR